jgi:NAD(P)-dependent dehydrogenase (short-subunit alcohol dehydrogenase family)
MDANKSGAGRLIGGRVAVVTGAGRGLGRAMALGLARAGVRVVATAAREQSEIEVVAAKAGEDMIIPVIADVTKEEDAQRVVGIAMDRYGKLDVLVNNAGRGMKYVSRSFMTDPPRFWQVDPETWRMIIDTNVNGPFLMARAAVAPMIQANWGRIINVSVSRSTMHRPGFSPYGPSKAALESATSIWAQELRDAGVTVNSLLPGGPTLTGMIPDEFPQSARNALLQPEIMIAPLLWLISEESGETTGCRITASKWNAGDPRAAIEDAAFTPTGA